MLATDACRQDINGGCVEVQSLVEIDAPTEYCTGHTSVNWCEGGGGIANSFCALTPGNTVTAAGVWSGEDCPYCSIHDASTATGGTER